ncbi:MAG: Catabolite control protein A [Lentisphaerae bacterium ADurb.Bin242]|nr:MAG: Catabolite control protein A [Lentisphaerae bacterium ADurb.Bin242]
MANLSEIAAKLNLNVSVVSRALNPNPDKNAVVRKETCDLIRRTAQEMGYRPNRQASFLKKGKSPTILCFLPDVPNDLIADLMFGISETACHENFPVNFLFGSKPEDFGRFLKEAENAGHSGILSYPPQKMPEEIRREAEAYTARGGKMLFLNVTSNTPGFGELPEEFKKTPQLNIDDYYGCSLVAKHFLDQGCEEFYWYNPESSYLKARAAGFSMPLLKAGCSVRELDESVLEKVFENKKRTGIFAIHDGFALHLFQRMLKSGVIPGNRILLAGFNDLRFCAQLKPGLTTVHQPMRQEGMTAVQKLIRMIFGGKEKNETLKPYLVIRASTNINEKTNGGIIQ